MNQLHSKHILLLLWMILCFRKTDHIGCNGEGYPPFWNRTSSSLEDFINEHKIVINFWNYLDRMSIYRTLLNATSSYIYKTESKNMRNALWGLPLQHGWQYQTGRLGDTATVNNTKQQSLDPTISPRSWWACMNYYLCAIPFLGAVDAGLFNNFPHEIELTQPEEFQSDFCSGVTDCKISCPEAMAEWKTFFEFIRNSSQVPEQSSTNHLEEEEIVSLMWKAHVESIRIALPICSKRLNYLSAPERNFGRNWATTVEYLAAAYFPTDFESVNNFQKYLPPRQIKEGDKAPNIADFGVEQNRILLALDWLNKGNTLSVGHLLQLWKKAMCSEEGRAAGRRLMQNMIDNSKFGLSNMIAIITELIKNLKCEG